MLAIVAPDRSSRTSRAVCERWGLRIGGDRRARRRAARSRSARRARSSPQVPASLAHRRRSRVRPAAWRPTTSPSATTIPRSCRSRATCARRSSPCSPRPNVASKRWVCEQYDSIVQGQTVAGAGQRRRGRPRPGHAEGRSRCRATARAGSARLDPYLGAAHAVAEAARNVAVTRREAARDHELHELRQPRAAGRDVAVRRVDPRACATRAWRSTTPVTGGNVSFYNESGDSAIWPTPVIGMLGLLEDYRLRVPTGFPRRGLGDLPAGRDVRRARAARSSPRSCSASSPGARRRWTSSASARSTTCCTRRRADDLLASAHDCGDGGLAIALAEAGDRLSGHGFAVTVAAATCPPHVALFTESASRAVVSVAPERDERARRARRRARRAVRAAGRDRRAARRCSTGCSRRPSHELRDVYEGAIPRLLGERLSVGGSSGGHVRLLGHPRVRGRGHRRRGGRHHASAQLRRWSEILACGRHAGERRRDRRGVRRELGGLPRALAWRTSQHGPADATPLICDRSGWTRRRRCAPTLVDVVRRGGPRARRCGWRPGVEECLAALKDAGVRLGIVCDVGMTASPTLRERLDDVRGAALLRPLVVLRRGRLLQAVRRRCSSTRSRGSGVDDPVDAQRTSATAGGPTWPARRRWA